MEDGNLSMSYLDHTASCMFRLVPALTCQVTARSFLLLGNSGALPRVLLGTFEAVRTNINGRGFGAWRWRFASGTPIGS